MDRELTEVEIQQLTDRIADTAAHIDAAIHVLLRDIRVLDESGAWHTMGALSCAHYLSWRIGMGLGTAREKVRVAQALATLPLVDAALAQGRLSYSKVRAITRVATAENEELLLDMAMASTAAQLEKICRFYRQTAPREGSDDERRWVTHQTTDDGMVRISMQLRAEVAATVLKAIDVSAGAGCPADGFVHEGGFTVELTDDGPVFRDSAGKVVTEVFERPALERPVEELKWRIFANGIEIDPDGQIPDWDGLSPDYERVVDVLCVHGGPPP